MATNSPCLDREVDVVQHFGARRSPRRTTLHNAFDFQNGHGVPLSAARRR